METFQTRLISYIEHLNLSKYAFAKSIGISSSRFYATLQPKRKPSGDILERLTKHYPELNADWLLTGKGKMIKSSNRVKQEQVVHAGEDEPETPTETPIFIMEQEKIEQTPVSHGFIDLTECAKKYQEMEKAYYEQLLQNNKILHENSDLKDKLIEILLKKAGN